MQRYRDKRKISDRLERDQFHSYGKKLVNLSCDSLLRGFFCFSRGMNLYLNLKCTDVNRQPLSATSLVP